MLLQFDWNGPCLSKNEAHMPRATAAYCNTIHDDWAFSPSSCPALGVAIRNKLLSVAFVNIHYGREGSKGSNNDLTDMLECFLVRRSGMKGAGAAESGRNGGNMRKWRWWRQTTSGCLKRIEFVASPHSIDHLGYIWSNTCMPAACCTSGDSLDFKTKA